MCAVRDQSGDQEQAAVHNDPQRAAGISQERSGIAGRLLGREVGREVGREGGRVDERVVV